MTHPSSNITFVPTTSNLAQVHAIYSELSSHPEFSEKHHARLSASELAFFAHDASLYYGPKGIDTLHPSFSEFRAAVQDPQERSLIEMRIRRALFDHAALLDQITGGTTLAVIMPGAAEPGTPASEDYVKAYTYFPGSIVDELTEQNCRDSIPDLLQLVIRELGVPTLRRFGRSIDKLHKGSRRSKTHLPRPLPEIRGIPEPIPYNSSRYVFYGRKLHRMCDAYQREAIDEEDMDSNKAHWDSEATLSSFDMGAQEHERDV